MITYNNIVTALNNFADNHFFIKAFTHGNIEEMDLEKDGSYPLMHLVYLGANYEQGTKDYNFEIYLVDIPPTKVDKISYQREVISNLEQCVEDLLADLSNGFNIFNENFEFDTESASLTPLEEEGSNVLSGVALDITISVPYTHDSCNAPLTGVTPTSGDCEDATIKATEGDDDIVTITTVASGATYTFSKIAIKQQDAATIGYGRIAKAIKVTNADISAVVETATEIEVTVDGLPCADSTIKATEGDDDVVTLTTVASGAIYTFPKLEVRQQDASVQGYGRVDKRFKLTNADITSVVETATEIEVTATVSSPSGIQYSQILRTVDTSYDTYDNGWWFINRNAELRNPTLPYPATIQTLDLSAADPQGTLKYDNVHGNKNRFTAQDGTQTVSAGGVIEDHLFYMEWINTFFSSATRANHLANSEADTTDGGATNHWRLCSARDLVSLFDYGNSSVYNSLFPFTATYIWTSDRYAPSSTLSLYCWGGVAFSRRSAGTYTYRGAYCRKGTW